MVALLVVHGEGHVDAVYQQRDGHGRLRRLARHRQPLAVGLCQEAMLLQDLNSSVYSTLAVEAMLGRQPVRTPQHAVPRQLG